MVVAIAVPIMISDRRIAGRQARPWGENILYMYSARRLGGNERSQPLAGTAGALQHSRRCDCLHKQGVHSAVR